MAMITAMIDDGTTFSFFPMDAFRIVMIRIEVIPMISAL